MAATSEEEEKEGERERGSTETIKLTGEFTVGAIYRDGVTQQPRWIVADFGELLLGDGKSYPRDKYPILYAAIDNQYGDGDTELEFRVPDFRSSFEVIIGHPFPTREVPVIDEHATSSSIWSTDEAHPMVGMNQDIGKLMERIYRLERLALFEYDHYHDGNYVISKKGEIITQIRNEHKT